MGIVSEYFLVILFVLCVVLFVRWRLQRAHLYVLAEKIPPIAPMLPLIGHLHYTLGNREQMLKNILMFAEGPSPGKIWAGPYLFIGITKPEHLEICFKQALEKSDLYQFTKQITGDSIFVASVPKWKANRKTVSPAFNQRLMDSFVPVFMAHSAILVDKISRTEGKTFDVDKLVAKCFMDLVCETVMGIKVDSQSKDGEFQHMLHKAMNLIAERTFNYTLYPDFLFKRTNCHRDMVRTKQYIDDFTQKIIDEKKRKLQEDRLNSNTTGTEEVTKIMKPVLERLIEFSEENEDFGDKQLRDESLTFLIGGIDTTSTVVSFSLLMLAMHPKEQAKLYNEIIRVVGFTSAVEYHHLPKLVYLEMVINETMRLFPIGSVVSRKITEDIELDNCTLPKGASIIFGMIGTHRSPKYFPNPLKFDPNRFLPEEVVKRHPHAFCPFTLGPRNCIGRKFAMMAMKTVIATVLRTFYVETDLESVESVKLEQSMILKSKSGYNIRATQR